MSDTPLSPCDVAVPEWNDALGVIQYVSTFGNGKFIDVLNSLQKLFDELTQQAQTNQLNRSWSAVIDPNSTIITPFQTGEVDLNQLHIGFVNCQIQEFPPSTDFWWGSASFAKFAVLAWTLSGAMVGEAKFINYKNHTIANADSTNDGAHVILLPGVRADFATAAYIEVPEIAFNTGSGFGFYPYFQPNTFNYSD